MDGGGRWKVETFETEYNRKREYPFRGFHKSPGPYSMDCTWYYFLSTRSVIPEIMCVHASITLNLFLNTFNESLHEDAFL